MRGGPKSPLDSLNIASSISGISLYSLSLSLFVHSASGAWYSAGQNREGRGSSSRLDARDDNATRLCGNYLFHCGDSAGFTSARIPESFRVSAVFDLSYGHKAGLMFSKSQTFLAAVLSLYRYRTITEFIRSEIKVAADLARL